MSASRGNVGRAMLVVGSLAAFPASARTIFVPSAEAPTIQAGLDASIAGDSVEVACGTYFEHSLVMKSGVTFRSQTGLADCVVVDAQGLGRVLLCGPSGWGTLIEGLTFTGGLNANPADLGGGVLVDGAGGPLFKNCDFSENVSVAGGGAIGIRVGRPAFRYCVMSGNTAERGGAIAVDGGSVVLVGCAVSGNDAGGDGGAIWAAGTVTADSSEFADNAAPMGAGGAIHCESGNLGMKHTDMERNVSATGGAVRAADMSTNLQDCTLVDNRALTGTGGAISMDAGSLTMARCEISRNFAGSSGGGVYTLSTDIAWADCSFVFNEGRGGAGAYVRRGNVFMERTIFDDNLAGAGDVLFGDGGGLLCFQASLQLEDCTFRRNGGVAGGGLDVSSTSASVFQCRFLGNWANDGGGVQVKQSSTTFEECVFQGNRAQYVNTGAGFGRGGAFFALASGETEIIACDFIGDSARVGAAIATFNGPQVTVYRSIVTLTKSRPFERLEGSDLAISCTNSYGNFGENWPSWMGPGNEAADNFSADPGFCNAAIGNFRLRQNSMCAAGRSPCGWRVGAFDVNCAASGVYLATRPGELAVRGDGIEKRSDALFEWAVGTSHEIEAPDNQEWPAGVRRVFRSWSDGGARIHTIAVGSASDVFTAQYDSLYSLHVAVSGQGQASPLSDWWTPGQVVPIQAAPESGWAFAEWVGSGPGSYTGTQADTTVTMLGPVQQTAHFRPAVPLNIFTNPAGLTVRVDGVVHISPVALLVAQFTTHVVELDTLQTLGPGHRARFLDWREGGGSTLLVGVGEQSVNLAAAFRTEYQLTFEATDQAQFLPGDSWLPAGQGVSIQAVFAYGAAFGGWIGTGAGSYTGPSNPATVTMLGPVHERAVFGPPFSGNGYEFSLSASATDPFVNVGSPTGSAREIHLWLTCSELGLTALEMGVEATMPIFPFIPAEEVVDAGTGTDLRLSIARCPTGSTNLRLGKWVVLDTGGRLCAGPSSAGGFATFDCRPGDPQAWPEPRVTGFASDGSSPCVVGTNECFGPTPIALSGLAASVGERRVEISWFSGASLPDDSFRVYRREIGAGSQRLAGELQEDSGHYTWVDTDVQGDRTYDYEIGVDVRQGTEERHGPVRVTTPYWPPRESGLGGAYPNPIAGNASLRFSIANPGHVRLSLFDVAGRLVERFVDTPLNPGEHAVLWNADRRLPGGIYFLRLETGGRTWSAKVALVETR